VKLQGALIIAVSAGAMLAAGCAYSPGLAFPIEQGNIAAGRQAFIDHQCNRCHSVAGVDLPQIAGAPPPLLELGGETSMAKSYEELLTSIINPNHSISDKYREQQLLGADVPVDSPMPMPEVDNMTVRQLIDIVAFLDSRYVLVEDYGSD
jgi:sulfur-oxidizing protein SoxX